MAKSITCQCGQPLDLEDFAPGDQVQCPQCQAVLTVPADEPPAAEAPAEAETETPEPPADSAPTGDEPAPVAMAVAIEDDSEDDAPASAAAGYLNPIERRRRAQQKADYAAQAKLRKLMIWPSLILGLASLGVAALGFYWAFLAEAKITIETDEQGQAHLYAQVPAEFEARTELRQVQTDILLAEKDLAAGPDAERAAELKEQIARLEQREAELKKKVAELEGTFERIEVRPDILPGDTVDLDEFGNPIITLEGEKLQRLSGYTAVLWDGRLIPVEQSGFWFYEVDPDTGDVVGQLDLPIVAQEQKSQAYRPVRLEGTEFVSTKSGKPLAAAFYRAEDKFATQALGEFKYSGPPMGIQPAWFIVPGLVIGGLLLLAAVFFIREEAKAKRRKQAAEEKAAEAEAA